MCVFYFLGKSDRTSAFSAIYPGGDRKRTGSSIWGGVFAQASESRGADSKENGVPSAAADGPAAPSGSDNNTSHRASLLAAARVMGTDLPNSNTNVSCAD